jgi:hypothetical protein
VIAGPGLLPLPILLPRSNCLIAAVTEAVPIAVDNLVLILPAIGFILIRSGENSSSGQTADENHCDQYCEFFHFHSPFSFSALATNIY